VIIFETMDNLNEDPYPGASFFENNYREDYEHAQQSCTRLRDELLNDPNSALQLITEEQQDRFKSDFTLYQTFATTNSAQQQKLIEATVKKAMSAAMEYATTTHWSKDSEVRSFFVETILRSSGKTILHRIMGPTIDTRILKAIIEEIGDFRSNALCPKKIEIALDYTNEKAASVASDAWKQWQSDTRKTMRNGKIKKKYAVFFKKFIETQSVGCAVKNIVDVKNAIAKSTEVAYLHLSQDFRAKMKKLGLENYRLRLTDPIGYSVMKVVDNEINFVMKTDKKMKPVSHYLNDLKVNLKKKMGN